MLAIRLQRKGRRGDAFYRIVVQEARRHPSSGRLVRQIGTFNPHTKEANLNKDDAKFFLDNGAQPSSRVAVLLKSEGVKLPKWVEIKKNEKRDTRNPEKLRKNQPKEEPAPEAESKTEEAKPEEKKEPSAEPDTAADKKAEDKPEDKAEDSEEKAEATETEKK